MLRRLIIAIVTVAAAAATPQQPMTHSSRRVALSLDLDLAIPEARCAHSSPLGLRILSLARRRSPDRNAVTA